MTLVATETMELAPVRYDADKAALDMISKKSNMLTVVEDEESLKVVKMAIKELANARNDIEQQRKRMKDVSLQYGRKVDSIAKEYQAIINPEEERLKALRDAYLAEQAEIQRQAEIAAEIAACWDDAHAQDKEETAKAERRRIDMELLEKQRLEQEAREKALQEREAAIERAERDKQVREEAAEAERKRIADEQEAEQARIAAEEVAAKLKAAQAPDREKLQTLKDAIICLEIPDLSDEQAQDALNCSRLFLSKAIDVIDEFIDA